VNFLFESVPCFDTVDGKKMASSLINMLQLSPELAFVFLGSDSSRSNTSKEWIYCDSVLYKETDTSVLFQPFTRNDIGKHHFYQPAFVVINSTGQYSKARH